MRWRAECEGDVMHRYGAVSDPRCVGRRLQMSAHRRRMIRLLIVLAIVTLPALLNATNTRVAEGASGYDDRLGVLTVTSFDISAPWIALTFDTNPQRGQTDTSSIS
jgi:hypothetical protein